MFTGRRETIFNVKPEPFEDNLNKKKERRHTRVEYRHLLVYVSVETPRCTRVHLKEGDTAGKLNVCRFVRWQETVGQQAHDTSNHRTRVDLQTGEKMLNGCNGPELPTESEDYH